MVSSPPALPWLGPRGRSGPTITTTPAASRAPRPHRHRSSRPRATMEPRLSDSRWSAADRSGAVAASGCENLRVPALSRLDGWRFAVVLAAASAVLGVAAGIDPRLAIAGALSLGFMLLVLADLYVGLILFTVI